MTQPLRVLIVEDQPSDAKLLVQELRRAEYEPAWELVATEADFLRRLRPEIDLILLDGGLPGCDAGRILELIRARSLNTPVIVVTGSLADERAVEFMKEGAADYLLKDRLARLGQAVSRVLLNQRDVKERKLAEQRLRESEERLRQITENLREATFLRSADFMQFFYVSPVYETVSGRTCASLYENPRRRQMSFWTRHSLVVVRRLSQATMS
jgi:DNA-binding NtrC family response regulator